MKKSTVRIFAIVLVVLMCLSLLPLAAAHAMEYPAEMPEIPGFTWMGDHYVETEHIYGEVANKDFLVDESEPGDCETPALYWRSCINRNPITEERCGVTAETAYQEALQRAANDLNTQRNSGVQHTDSEWQDIWNRTAEEILNRYTFYYGGFGHQWVEVEYQPATCEQDGWETYHYCSACGEGLDYIPLIPATGHRYEDGICAVCGKADPDYAPVASSDNSAFALSDSAGFNSDEPGEEQGNEPLPNNDEISVGNADGNVVITYNANGGVGDDYTQTIAADATNDTLTPCGFTREHYTFIGWNTADDGTGDSFDDQQDVTAASFSGTAVTLYAQWRRSEVRIIFDGNGGNSDPAMEDQLIELGTGDDLRANTYTLAGHAFLGWSTRQDGSSTGTYFTDNQHVTVDSFETAVVTLYAQWDEIVVTFNGNFGSEGGVLGSAFTTGYPVNGGLTLPKANTSSTTTVRRNGPYKFVGWNTSPDGVGGKHFADGADVTTADIPVRTTLYAEWQKVITVYYNANNGGENYNGGVFQPGIPITVKALKDVATPTPSKPGRTFSGEWNTAADGSGDVYKPGDSITLGEEPAVWTFYAQWDFDVTLNQNAGSGSTKKVPVRENKEYTVPELPEEFTYDKETVEFKGWNTESTGNGTSYAPGDTIPGNKMTQPFTLYARWADKHTITFNGNGVTEGVPDPIVAEEKTDVTLPSMTREGYKFVGWATSADGDMKYPDTLPAKDFTGDMILYAVWQENPKVTLNPQNNEDSQVVSINDDGSITLPEPERDGYKFLGWATSSDGAPVYHATIPASDVATLDGKTLYGKWDKEYTVTYHQNAGTTDTKTKDQTIYESDLNKEPVALSTIDELEFENSGKVFTGWKTEDGTKTFGVDGKIEKDDFGTGSTSLDLFAVWKDYATITFDKNSTAATGTMDPMKVTDEDKPLTANAFTRTGYQFMGWNTDKNGDGTAFKDEEKVNTSVIIADVTLYAQWSKIFKIQYMSNGGSGIMPNQEALSGVELEIAANGFTKTGADFDSWNTKADGSGTTYKAGDKHTFKETDSDLTLYAQWTYPVTFETNGGTGYIVEGNTDKAFEKQDYDIPENMSEGEEPKPLITKTDYAFNGWNTKADGTGDKYADGGTIPASKVTGPITLYAQWDQEYTVNFNNTADASQTMEPQIILKSVLDKAGATGVALKANTFTRDGYVFTGWDTLAAGGGKHFDDGAKVKGGDDGDFTNSRLDLYAQWKEEVVITFHRNYDTTLADKTQSVPEKTDAKLNPNTYARQGYVFDAWYTSPSGTGDRYEDGGTIPADKVEGDIELYAHWIGPVEISGSSSEKESYGYVGETLTCSIAPTEKISLQWVYKDALTDTSWKKISGQTSQTFTPTSAYIGKYVACAAVTEDAEGEDKNILSTNNKQITNKLTGVSFKQDLIDVVNEQAASTYAQPGQIQGVTKNMQYSTDGGYSWSDVTNVSDAGVMSVLKPGTYIFRIKDIKGASIESDPVVIDRWFTFSYTTSNTTSTSTSSSGNTSSSTGSGTVQLQWNGKSMPTNTSPTTNSPDVVKYSGGTNMWLVREGTDDVITMTIRPSSGSYGHWNINGGSYANVSSESTITVTPLNGPEHYNIIFNRSSSSPRTADESHLGLWSALCLISLTGAATILGKTFKRKKTR